MSERPQLLVVGASAGGMNALGFLFKSLNKRLSVPVLVSKHVATGGDDGMLKVLARQSVLPVSLATDKQKLEAGHIYLAPSGYHLLVEGKNRISLSLDEPVWYVRPSIDVLFQSAASVYGQSLAALILTGANPDGTEGVVAVKQYGGITLAEDPSTAEVSIMPQSAIDSGCIDHVVSLRELPEFLQRLL